MLYKEEGQTDRQTDGQTNILFRLLNSLVFEGVVVVASTILLQLVVVVVRGGGRRQTIIQADIQTHFGFRYIPGR